MFKVEANCVVNSVVIHNHSAPSTPPGREPNPWVLMVMAAILGQALAAWWPSWLSPPPAPAAEPPAACRPAAEGEGARWAVDDFAGFGQGD